MEPRSFLSGLYRFAGRRKGYLLLAFVVFAVFMLFTPQAKAVAVLLVLGAASSLAVTYKRVVRLPPAFELISLTSAVVTLVYGPVVGVFYTVASNIASEVVSGYPDAMSLTYIPSRSAQVLFVYLFRSWDVAQLGIWSVVVFNLVQQPIFMWLTDAEKRLKSLYFVILNVPLNILIFRFLGHPLLSLLQTIA